MKRELSAIDIHFLVEELKVLLGGKIDQIYQKAKEEFIFQIHIPNIGKKTLRIVPGKLIYMAASKGEMPEKPPAFCLYLRKYLRNARIRDIRQLDLERIIELDLETKERKYKLVMELFSRGNLIICDEEYTIYSAMETQVWSERTVKAKLKYTYPKREHNILEITKQALQELLERSDKANMVKTLATDLGIGGLYAEEICLLAEIDKNKNAKKLSGPEIKRLFESIKRLREQKLKAMQILDDQDEVLDIIPIELDCYSKQNKKQFASFNEALDKFFTPHEAEKKKQAVTKQITTKLDKITVMINEQNKRISGLERSAAENQRKGELMFEHYTEINDILKKIIELRKKHSWAEIKEMLKNEKMIKNIDEKKGELVVEIE